MNKGGNSMKNYQTLNGFALVAIAIIIAAVIISGALNDFASSIVSGLSYLADKEDKTKRLLPNW